MFTSVNSRDMQAATIASAKHAGVNWLFGTFGSDVATSLGVRQTDFFDFWADAKKRGYHGTGGLDLSAYIETHGQAVCIGFDGAPGKTPCPVWMAEDIEGIWDAITAELDELKKRTPNTSALFWDYEFHPYANGKDACYTAFSKLGMRRFSEKFNISEALTPQIIKDKYHSEWFRFLGEIHQENTRRLHALCTERRLLLLTWTDYISAEKTGFDLALTSPYTDIVMCGYGRHADLLQEISYVAGNKLNTGILYKEMFSAAPSVAKIARRVLDGRNGFHTWFPGGFDGLFLYNLSVASRSLVRHEDLIMDGKKLDVRQVSGYDPENIYAFGSGEKVVIFIINESSGPEISCELPVNKILQRRVHDVKEFYTGASFVDGDKVPLKIPAHNMRCLEMEFAEK